MKKTGSQISRYPLFVQKFMIITILSISIFGLLPFTSVTAQDPQELIDRILYDHPEIQQTSNTTFIWDSPQISMLIITPDRSDFQQAAKSYAQWKTERGIPSIVVSDFSNFSGVDFAAQIRNAIQYYYAEYDIEWVLLLGDTDLIPIRYVRNEDTPIISNTQESYGAVGGEILKPTDYYYAELTADWNIDGDEYWGESAANNDESNLPELDYEPEVYVGRFPVETSQEVYAVLNKTMIYESGVNVGDWAQEYLAISGISDYPDAQEDADGEDEARLNQYIIDHYLTTTSMNWTHALEHTSYYTPPSDPRIKDTGSTNEIDLINNGVSIVTYAGHGSPNYFDLKKSAHPLSTFNINDLTNNHNPVLIYGDACSTNRYDMENSLGEEIILKEEGGAIGYIGAMRVSWYYPNDTDLEMDNRGMLKHYFREMFLEHHYQQGKALYEAKKAYVADDWFQYTLIAEGFDYFEMERKTLLSYMLLGDPSVDIYTDTLTSGSLDFPADVSFFKQSTSTLQIRNGNDQPVPYARVKLTIDSGKSRVFTADQYGYVQIFIPDVDSLNYTIYGHNLLSSSTPMTIQVQSDQTSPKILNTPQFNKTSLSMQDSTAILAQVEDDQSGPQQCFVVLSRTNFRTYDLYPMMLDISENRTSNLQANFSLVLTGWPYGDHEYFVLAMDGARNYDHTYFPETLQTISVTKPFPITLIQVGTASLVLLGTIGIGWEIWKSLRSRNRKG